MRLPSIERDGCAERAKIGGAGRTSCTGARELEHRHCQADEDSDHADDDKKFKKRERVNAPMMSLCHTGGPESGVPLGKS